MILILIFLFCFEIIFKKGTIKPGLGFRGTGHVPEMQRCVLIALALVAAACVFVVQKSARERKPVTVFLLVDGLRRDFVDLGECSSLRAMFENAQTYVPVYPTRSAPNYWSLATGKLPREHGIVGNEFFDSELNATYTWRATKGPWYDAADPLWTLTRKKTAVLRWYGTEARSPLHGIGTEHDDAPTSERVADVLQHIKEGAEFVMSTVSIEIDDAGHKFGPDSPETRARIASTCSAVASLVHVVRRDHPGSAIFITGDHGIANITSNAPLPELPAGTRVFGHPVSTVWAAPGRETETEIALKNTSARFADFYDVVRPANATFLGKYAATRGGTFVVEPRTSQSAPRTSLPGGDHGCNPELASCSDMEAAYLGPPIFGLGKKQEQEQELKLKLKLNPSDIFQAVLSEL